MVPSVDIRLPEHTVVAQLAAACEHPGFFYLEGLEPVRASTPPARAGQHRGMFELPVCSGVLQSAANASQEVAGTAETCLDACRQFFALPPEAKQAVVNDASCQVQLLPHLWSRHIARATIRLSLARPPIRSRAPTAAAG